MARGDVRIDFDTNDLLIEKSKSNIYSQNSWRYDISLDLVIVSIFIPSRYADGVGEIGDDWRTYVSVSEIFDSIVSYDTKPISVEYQYLNDSGLYEVMSLHSLASYDLGGEINYFTVLDFNNFILGLDDGEYASFKYVSSTYSADEVFCIEKTFLGDFVVEDMISQNEYILLNLGEGSLHQNPLQGVGLDNYLQSPASNQQLIDTVIEKFAQDSLRVIGISRVDENLTIESEDYNV